MSDDSQIWTTKEGEVTARLVMPGVVRLEMKGYAVAATATGIVAFFERQFALANTLETFWDLEAMERYDPAIRTESVSVLLRHRKKLASVHALAKSIVVRMGVSVANLALGGMLRSYDARPRFEQEYQATLSRCTRATG